MRSCALALLILLAGCGKSGQKVDGSATIDGSVQGGDAIADVVPDGRYTQGVYSCCAKGEGLACCPPESLPDPSIGRIATCFQYGGVRGDCVTEGEDLEAKDICSICCPGLTRLENCVGLPPSNFFCGACGNGVCGPGENTCNCPADCP
jgi:hypothetical protein